LPHSSQTLPGGTDGAKDRHIASQSVLMRIEVKAEHDTDRSGDHEEADRQKPHYAPKRAMSISSHDRRSLLELNGAGKTPVDAKTDTTRENEFMLHNVRYVSIAHLKSSMFTAVL